MTDAHQLATTALALVFPALAIVAALRDAATMTIPNWISASLALLFFPAAFAAGMSLGSIGLALLIGLAALAGGIVLFAMGWVGGGDAKLLAACTLWFGLAAPNFLLFTALSGGALALILLSARKFSFAVHGPAWLERLLKPGGDVPYGLAICAGALLAFPDSPLIKALVGG